MYGKNKAGLNTSFLLSRLTYHFYLLNSYTNPNSLFTSFLVVTVNSGGFRMRQVRQVFHSFPPAPLLCRYDQNFGTKIFDL